MIFSNKGIAAACIAVGFCANGAYAIDNGGYTIQSKYSAKLVEVSSAQSNDGANISQWAANQHNTQRWIITNVGGNNYSVINLNSGKAMEVYDWSTADGANVAQYEYSGVATQHWQINDNDSGYVSFINANSGKALDLFEFNGNDGANISQWAYNGSDAQLWQLKSYNGRSWLYYSISTFGSRVSAIGLTSATSVSAGSWRDDGLVINTTNSNNYNAIDPDLVVAKDGAPWLVFGSWNSGIKLMRINPMTMKPFGELYSLASRSGGIEAPTIVYRQGYYYLFVSVGKCCAGTDSTYRIAYGRASDIRGPYLDKNGNNMLSGGGSILDAGNSQWVGPGGQDILNTDVMVRHAYDAGDNGVPKLLISTLNWDSNGWPRF